jgi:hypothetical protein
MNTYLISYIKKDHEEKHIIFAFIKIQKNGLKMVYHETPKYTQIHTKYTSNIGYKGHFKKNEDFPFNSDKSNSIALWGKLLQLECVLQCCK